MGGCSAKGPVGHAEPAGRWDGLCPRQPGWLKTQTHRPAPMSPWDSERHLSPRERPLTACTTPPTLRPRLSHQRLPRAALPAGPPTGPRAGVSPQGRLSALRLLLLSRFATAL